jgi:tetratricopeptide (TPR) repeat protein
MAKRKRSEPTSNEYVKCAEVAHEYNELLALGELGPLLEAERNHSYLCQLGVWYWDTGHKKLAIACYRRSLEIHSEGPTYFNLAVCLDDMASELEGDSDMIVCAREKYAAGAIEAIMACYALTTSTKEQSSIKSMLTQNGKEHLAKAAADGSAM